MRSRIRPAIVLLCVVGAIDLLTLPLAVAAHHEYPDKPPAAAIIAVAIFGLVTLASALGLAQGRRWSRPAALTCRVLDSVSWLLGLVAHPDLLLTTIAATGLILSIVTIVLLVRLNPRMHHQDEAARGQIAAEVATPRLSVKQLTMTRPPAESQDANFHLSSNPLHNVSWYLSVVLASARCHRPSYRSGMPAIRGGSPGGGSRGSTGALTWSRPGTTMCKPGLRVR